MKLDWIKELISKLPETSIERKNMIAIAGYPKWENVNSNLLAFYLDEEEEHGFQRLFMDSLLDLIDQSIEDESIFQRDLFETPFNVERESPTEKGGRIDLLIKGVDSEDEMMQDDDTNNDPAGSWAIIIENKLFANLANNIEDYWDSVNTESKFFVLLSVDPISIPPRAINDSIRAINITHKELTEKIRDNLSAFYLEADDRHLLYLKEYMMNIRSFYTDTRYHQNMDQTLELFRSQKEDIERFKKEDLNLLKYISNEVIHVMEEFGYQPTSAKNTSKGKHFLINPDIHTPINSNGDSMDIAKMFRFWVNMSHLRYNKSFSAIFELFGQQHTALGDHLNKKLQASDIYTYEVQKGIKGRAGYGYLHIYKILIPIEEPDNDSSFRGQLKYSLSKHLFDHQNRFIETAIRELKELMEKPK